MNRELAVRITFFLLRVVAGLMFAQVGSTILLGWFGGSPGGRPPLMTETGIGGIIETVGGTLVAVGLFTRPAAFLLSGTMAVAYFQFHAPHGPWPFLNQGQPAVLYCFIFLFISAFGCGDWSLDAVLAKGKTKN